MANKLQPSAFTNMPLWPAGAEPHAQPGDEKKVEHFWESEDAISRLTDVMVPTLTFYPATAVGDSTSPAVLVCPGGGYGILAWNHEGQDIAAWLNSIGVSAFLLKYRCPDRREGALADAARAIRYIRANAANMNVNPEKIGIIGFSAGAHLSARLSTLPAAKVPYEPIDAADELNPRPDFQMIIYPAYMDRENWGCDPDFEITDKTPPAFIMQAEDDTLWASSIAYFIAMKKAGVDAELHVFPKGGHGYGLLRNGKPTQVWPDLARDWLYRDIIG